MSNKLIPYDVVYCSSEDEGHTVDNLVGFSYQSIALEEGTPGWLSGKEVGYPQVLIVRFPGNARLQQTRLLSNEVKIASKVEIKVYKLSRDELRHPPSFRDVRFTNLGYVQFSTNEQSRYEARERKTVHLKAEAYFIKFLFYEPHENAMNRGRQVGLYALECLGQVHQQVSMHADPQLSIYANTLSEDYNDIDDADGFPESRAERESASPLSILEPSPVSGRSKSQVSILEADQRQTPFLPPVRSAFRSVPISQFDTFFIRRVEELMALKEAGLHVGDVNMIHACDQKMDILNKFSLEMYNLEQEKVRAITEEDFEEAKRLKEAMERIMNTVIEESELPVIAAGPSYARSESHPVIAKKGIEPPQRFRSKTSSLPVPPSIPTVRESTPVPSVSPRLQEMPVEVEDIDEREVNTAVVGNLNVDDITDSNERKVVDFIFSIAGDDEREYVFPPSVVFDTGGLSAAVGPFVTACLLSKRFKLREAALVAITERMSDVYKPKAAEVEEKMLRLFDYSGYGLLDNITNVVLASCIYIRLCIGDEFHCFDRISTALGHLVPRLMTRAADPVPRIREEALGTLEQMVLKSAIPTSVFFQAVLAAPVDISRAKVQAIKPRPQLSRLLLLQMMHQERRLFAVAPGGLKQLYPSLLLPCINHANSNVREIACSIIQELVEKKIITLNGKDIGKIGNVPLREAVKKAVLSLPTEKQSTRS